MKIPKALFILIGVLTFSTHSYPQDAQDSSDNLSISTLFSKEEPLAIKLRYSNRELRKETNDSTYLESVLEYRDARKCVDYL